MNVYVHRAALYCEECAKEGMKQLERQALAEQRAEDIEEDDSESWYVGPHRNGGGEADSPQHCDSCGTFLENPLTSDGERYVYEMVAQHATNPSVGNHVVLDEWIEHYGLTLEGMLRVLRPKWMWWFDPRGNFLRRIDKETAAGCTPPGVDATKACREEVRGRGFAVPREAAINWLKEFGAWTLEELMAQSDEELAIKVWWIACGDTKESGEWLGLVH